MHQGQQRLAQIPGISEQQAAALTNHETAMRFMNTGEDKGNKRVKVKTYRKKGNVIL